MSADRHASEVVRFGVLGPVAAWDDAGVPLALRGPKHRAVLARLLVARGRVVPVTQLVDDLWLDPPPDAVGVIRTFVAALRRVIEPDRPPHAPARLLVTDGPGYALRVGPELVDAGRFEMTVAIAASLAPDPAGRVLTEALGWWRGPAYADVVDEAWAGAERARLTELRLHAVELRADALLRGGRASEAVPDLDAHVIEHPWREEGWRLLALALYRSGRQGDALAVLQRARALLVDQLGVDPGPAIRRLEADILDQAAHLEGQRSGTADQVWADVAAAYERAGDAGTRARIESTVGLLRTLAVTGGGGLEAARRHRITAAVAADELGDPELTARVIGAYDVPAIWTRSDDPAQAAAIVSAAERTLVRLRPDAPGAVRARLLATIAVESRGTGEERARVAAGEAEATARDLDDPAVLAFALNGRFMQTFWRAGLAPERNAIGAELVELSARHGLITSEVLGHLVRMQARSGVGDLEGAANHADAADELARRHELPLVGVFTGWFRALRLASTEGADDVQVERAYRSAAAMLDGAGMPGLEHGLLPLALLSRRVQTTTPAQVDDAIDWGPYEPWARPLVLLAQDRRSEAAAAVQTTPAPPRDLMFELLWGLTGRAAIAVGDRDVAGRAHSALAPAEEECAGAASGLMTLGPVRPLLEDLAALRDDR